MRQVLQEARGRVSRFGWPATPDEARELRELKQDAGDIEAALRATEHELAGLQQALRDGPDLRAHRIVDVLEQPFRRLAQAEATFADRTSGLALILESGNEGAYNIDALRVHLWDSEAAALRARREWQHLSAIFLAGPAVEAQPAGKRARAKAKAG